ncbi:MAG TPA: hypothetical protein VM599_06265 [Thermoanaerobaculia bacterium]|nr:hypothetical protein [Thermoanaerobaculia bacterium]
MAWIAASASAQPASAQRIVAKESETLQGEVGVHLEKEAEWALPLCPAGNIQYTVEIENIGTLAASAEILDPIPGGATFVPGSTAGGASYDPISDRVLWEGPLAPGASHSIGFSVTVDQGFSNGSSVVNLVTGRMSAGELVAETEVELPVPVNCPPLEATLGKGLSVAGTACPKSVVSYAVSLVNQTGRSHPVAATIEDPIPAGSDYVPGSVTGGATYDPGTDRIVWEGVLLPGGSRNLSFQVEVKDGTSGSTMVNEATATLTDPEVGDSAAFTKSVALPIEECPPPLDATLEKSASFVEPLCPGSGVTYSLKLTNTSGRAAVLDARIEDKLPAGLVILSDPTGGAQMDPSDPEGRTVVWEGSLGPGLSHTIGFVAGIKEDFEPDTDLVNVATAVVRDPEQNDSPFTVEGSETSRVGDCAPGAALEWRVLEASGVVEYKPPGTEDWTDAGPGDVLPLGTELSTGFDGAVRLGLFLDGEVVDELELTPLSSIELNLALFSRETIYMDVNVDFGEIRLEIKTGEFKADKKITAPNHVTGVRGTRLAILTNGLLDQVTLFESAIEVTLRESGETLELEVAEGEAALRITTDGVSVLEECRVDEPGCDPLPFPTTGAAERLSVSSAGVEAAGLSLEPTVSADGAIVAFSSLAANLVAGPLGAPVNVFVRDRGAGITELVSRAEDGTAADGVSGAPAVSADGSAVAFASTATNLVPGVSNGSQDIFVRDLATGAVGRVSVASDGSQAGGESSSPAISADGSVVAFASFAEDLVPGDTNGVRDVFVRDRKAGTTERVSVASDGTQADGPSGLPAISASGRFVAFSSGASNLAPGDGNGLTDVFVHDRVKGTTERVSVAFGGGAAGGASDLPAISADGRLVAFVSTAPDLVAADANGATADVFVRDRKLRVTQLVSSRTGGSAGNGVSTQAAISPDGRYVAFASAAEDLFPGDDNGAADVFLHDRETGETRLISVGGAGGANGPSTRPALAGDARLIVFESDATELVPGDTNSAADVFASPYEGTEKPGEEPPPEPPGEPPGPPPDPPDGPWLAFAELAGFEAKVRITPPSGEEVAGAAEPGCIVESLCVSGALPGRPEAFVKVIGPRPNGKLWTQISRFTPSAVEVWLRQLATDTIRYYRLDSVGPASDDVSGLQDREAFDPVGAAATVPRGALLPGGAVEPLPRLRLRLGTDPRPLEPGEPEPPAGLDWLTTPELPGFRMKAAITPPGGPVVGGQRVDLCIPETLCIHGALAGRPEVFAKIIGPRPNGFLWVQAARFTPSQVELWVEQPATGTVRYYRLEPVGPGADDVSGLQDRGAFLP